MDSIELQDENLQRQIANAREKAAVSRLVEPRAEAAYYDRDSGRIVIHLQHGAIFSFLAKLGQGLADASPDELAAVEVTPTGTGATLGNAGCGFERSGSAEWNVWQSGMDESTNEFHLTDKLRSVPYACGNGAFDFRKNLRAKNIPADSCGQISRLDWVG